ncbi:hypothetical protein RCC89_14150 [Cytophagaceae bacterium ABcell3]|nr:hypothetical protein RCC89_14150 [Cytophagaceae bacterium ABcell3]
MNNLWKNKRGDRMKHVPFYLIMLFVLAFCRERKNWKDEFWEDGSYKVMVSKIESPLDGTITKVKFFEEKNDTSTYLLEKYYDNDQMSERGRFELGIKDGLWKSWYKNGAKAIEVNYQMGKRSGAYRSWYPDGRALEEVEY